MEDFITNVRAFFDNDRFAASCGIKLAETIPGYAKATLEIGPNHLNAVNVVQGGAIFTLADFAFAVASNTHGKISLAINAEISFFKAVSSGKLTAIAQEISLHTKLATYIVDVSNENGELIAHFKGTVYRKNEIINFEPGTIQD